LYTLILSLVGRSPYFTSIRGMFCCVGNDITHGRDYRAKSKVLRGGCYEF
jgi:hypothetical protein